jgi:serine/threonine protein kinase
MGIDGRSGHREARGNNPYAQVLSDYGVDFEIAAPWLRVLRTRRIGGWKFHLSGRPSTAIDLLHRTLPILSAHKVAFKLAADPEILMGLNEGSFGDTQVGKFMTIYPRVGRHAAEIARQLIDATAGLSGPVVLTDLRIGDVVYARYGSFQPIIEQDRLGQDRILIRTARGRDIPDRYEIPFRLPPGIGLPPWLRAMAEPYRVKSTSNGHTLLGGFRPYQLIASNSKGAVMLALDLRRQESVSLCVLKQGRAHCLEDLSNRDIRQRLRHQAELGLELSQVIRTPRPGQYFEVGDSGYLPLERIVGQTLLNFVAAGPSAGMWEDLTVARRKVLINILRDVACQLSEMHARGIVHRDLSPTNVIIDEGDDAWILDLELGHRIKDRSPAFGKGTPGYMSPESDERARPAPEQDVYSFGCLMLFVLTGTDPRVSLRAGSSAVRNRTGSLRRAQPQLVQLLRDCLFEDPARRPTMRRVSSQLDDPRLSILHGSGRVPSPSRLEALIAAGVHSLVRDAPRTSEDDVWVSPLGTPDATSGSYGDYGVCRDAHHGVSGVVYLLSRLLRAGLTQKADVEPAIRTGLKWLADSDTNPLPGLYFGEAGVALACHEAVLAGVGSSTSSLSRSLDVVRTAPIDWWDVTHGAAGQGLAILQLSEEEVIEHRLFIEKLRSKLLESQLPDGSWVVPPGVEGLSGDTLTGFAHGCAGIIFFLTNAFRFLGDEQALAAAINGANWLLSCADRSSRGILRWPYSLRNREQWSWWCHGSPGISLAFLQLAVVTADVRFADAATLALGGLTQGIRPTNLSLCHGLSGLGETYLEAYEALGDRRWLTAAERIVRVVASTYHELSDEGVSWTVEDPYTTTADLMVGSGSVLHFFARFVSPGSGLGFAMLPPIGPRTQPIG